MFRRNICIVMMFLLTAVFCFGQTESVRDYVGIIHIRYHADVIAYMGKFKESFEKKGYSAAARAIDNYLKGLSGSGFVYVGPDGTNYVLTNEHVIAQSDSLSITFENLNGAKTTYDRLKVLCVDEEKDLAILVFADGVKPFRQGLSFSTSALTEGGEVWAAGFPGLGNAAIWQFSRGNITNAAARIPKSSDSDETIGPYIQHSAPIDPGNSGGPLLIETSGVPAGYAVIGMNTMSAIYRQATNYAVPINQINEFITRALSAEPVNEKELLSKRVDEFVRGLRANKAVYSHIADFLSYVCTAANAEYAISELLDKAPGSVQKDVSDIFSTDPVRGMNAAVAWLIENTMREKSITIRIDVDSINWNEKGCYDVVFKVNDTLIKSEWIKEYGVYRMETFGDTVAGNKSLLDEKTKQKDRGAALRTNYLLSLSGGYAHVLEYGPALNLSVATYISPITFGLEADIGLTDEKYFHGGLFVGLIFPIPIKTVAIMPFAEIGGGIQSCAESKEKKGNDTIMGFEENIGFGFASGLILKGGFIFTTAAVPGLFAKAFYQYSYIFMNDKNDAMKNNQIIGFCIGYGF